jgi:MoaA/NifB/PqqE/SkfB family radical SAM enzyme
MSKLCVLPWVSLETTPLGTVKPCCLADDVIPDIDLSNNTLQEAFDGEYMRDLRQQFRDGMQPETCRRCWNEESAGRTSKRMNSLARLRDMLKPANIDFDSNDGKLIFIDLKLGNICNLKCRICGSFSSSKWAQEEIEIQKEWPEDYKNTLPYQHLQKGQWPRKNEDFWHNMNLLLPHIR